ncbi:multidrug efflux system membrane fusion protein [Dongia mobilis]|uniref:Multidrug efflux system membrane fusion protein n=1 Tax=Dongia mobilis TaxID=578943 RepID=A0A4R6WU92_9PROT|nr:efflux RND transporter periplasmic adaptor subunit [Dongia mobilis]TDQ80488.1 multidrug efflux system membrane fusion protein [Dongia mobilis]
MTFPSPTTSQTITRAGIGLVAAATLLVLAACEKPQASAEIGTPPPPPKVSVAEVLRQPIHEWDEVTGRLEAPQSVVIRSRVSGYIDQVAFEEGALVQKGDLLFQIDPRPFAAEVRRLQAQLDRAIAQSKRAEAEAKRGDQLRAGKIIGSEEADARLSTADEARAAVVATRAQLEAAQLNLAFTEIRAPIDGRMSRAELTIGNLVRADDSRLSSIVSTDQVYAYFDIDESVYLKYSALTKSGEVGAAAPVYLGLTNEEGHPHEGRMDFLDNQVNPGTGTIRGRAVFDNRDGLFTPGLYARLKLVGSAGYVASLIDERAIGTDLGKKFVLVLDAGNKVAYRSIEIGPRQNGLRVVRQGLEAGDRIVVRGLQRVRPGMAVDPDIVPMADAATLAGFATAAGAASAN